MPTFLDLLTWLSSRNFFRVDKIYCYANLFHYANFSVVLGPNFWGGQTASGGSGTKPANSVTAVMWVILQTYLSTLLYIQCPFFICDEFVFNLHLACSFLLTPQIIGGAFNEDDLASDYKSESRKSKRRTC